MGKAAGQLRLLLRPAESDAMGDEMDAMIPEREMKVRYWPGPSRCLGAPLNGEARLPAAPPPA